MTKWYVIFCFSGIYLFLDFNQVKKDQLLLNGVANTTDPKKTQSAKICRIWGEEKICFGVWSQFYGD